jgi:hypothetical protein
MLESISEVVDLVDPALLGQPQVEAAFDGLRHVLKQAERRREARAKRLLQVRLARWVLGDVSICVRRLGLGGRCRRFHYSIQA